MKFEIGNTYKRQHTTFKVVSLYPNGDAEGVRWIKSRNEWSKATSTMYKEVLGGWSEAA